MNSPKPSLEVAVDSVLETLPPVWGRIRTNLRAAATEKFGISLEQFHILRHIRLGYQSVKDLAEVKQISRPAISQAVEILVQKGLVTRVQESVDRRCVHLDLTPYAREVLDANFEENRLWMKTKMDALAEEELLSIRQAMKILGETFAPGENQAPTR